MDEINLRGILEALLMSSESPLTIEQLQSVFDECPPEKEIIKQELANLARQYNNTGIELKQLASGFCIQTRAKYSYWVNRLNAEKPVKYSRALLETLAIIAYRQPVTRADIEEIRGVAVSTAIIKTLLERNWIRAAGYRDVPGRPAVYITTKFFWIILIYHQSISCRRFLVLRICLQAKPSSLSMQKKSVLNYERTFTKDIKPGRLRLAQGNGEVD